MGKTKRAYPTSKYKRNLVRESKKTEKSREVREELELFEKDYYPGEEEAALDDDD